MALVDRVASLATRVGQELKALALSKADDSAVVHLSGTETISGAKVFGAPPQVPVGTMAYHPVRRDDSRLADSRTPASHAGSHASGGSDAVSPASIGAAATSHQHAGGDITSGTVPYARLPVGTSASSVAAGNDARFNDARTPTAHASSHGAAGSDPVTPSAIGASAVGHIHLTSDVAPSARPVSYANLPGLVPSSSVALDVVTCTLTGNPTISPAAGTDGQVIRLRMLASGAQRTPSVGTSVRLGTGITDRAMPIPSGQWGVFGLEYIGGLNLWVLFSEYVVSAS